MYTALGPNTSWQKKKKNPGFFFFFKEQVAMYWELVHMSYKNISCKL